MALGGPRSTTTASTYTVEDDELVFMFENSGIRLYCLVSYCLLH